jgi:hypothetical protein
MATSPSSARGARSSEDDVIGAAVDHAPGAIPETEGVPPRTGSVPHHSGGEDRSVAEDLADGLELLRRAARKTLRAADPRLESLAERALVALRELDDQAKEEFATRQQSLEQAAQEVGRELVGAVERVARRIESAAKGRDKPPGPP